MRVIKRISLLFAVLMITLQLSAQVRWGVKGGYQRSSVYLTEGLSELTPDFRVIDAMSLGVVAELPLAPQISFQPELNYTTKGFAIREDIGLELFDVPLPVGVKAESRFRYLDMPLLVRLNFGEGPLQAYALAGPGVGFAFDGKLETKASALVDIQLFQTDINLDDINYQRFEVSGVIGGGFSYDTSVGKFFVDARYQHGFTGLYDFPVVEERIRNKGFGLSAGVILPLGGAGPRP